MANDKETRLITSQPSGKAQNEIADHTARVIRREICLDPISERYNQKEDRRDVWHPISKIKAEEIIEQSFSPWVPTYTASFLNSIIRLQRSRIRGPGWTTKSHLVPMENGIFDLRDEVLMPYHGDYFFNWRLPYSFDPDATCPKIDAWLSYATRCDDELTKFLLCWVAAVLTGRYDLQKFLVVTGHGGTGKGTLFRLIMQLIGKENVWVTTARRLEYNQYETSNLYGKRLTVITDAENYAGELTVLKQITGGDPIPYEKKYKDPEEPFLYRGMVMIAANQYLKSSDKTSAIFRRIISIIFNRIVPEDAKALNSNFEQSLSGELPGLFNKLVAIPAEEVTNAIRNLSPAVAASKIEAELETNPILAWVNERLIVCDRGKESQIGRKPETGGFAQPSRLYGDYIYFCESQGSKPVGLNNFSQLVVDNCVARGIRTNKARVPGHGGAILQGLRLRTMSDKIAYLFREVP